MPPFGVFSPQSPNRAPEPYPTPSQHLFGATGYCDGRAANGVSISSGYVVDAAKLQHLIDLRVGWTRTSASPFFDDRTHLAGRGGYTFADFDSAQCALLRHGIVPLIALEAGPVLYADAPGQTASTTHAQYRSAEDFADWCGTVASHERRAFPQVRRFSLPGNEVNSNREMFPAGEEQIASYARACYRAVKAAAPNAIVYGFELNMDGNLDAPGFVARMKARGCGIGTCYDAIAMHLSLRYPIPSGSTPCYPQPGGDYSLRCIAAIQQAAGRAIHVIIGETVYVVPGSVPDEKAKARAVVAAMGAFRANPYVDGVNYANVDECGLYPSGYFANGCLIDVAGRPLPAFDALQRWAQRSASK